MTSAAKLRLVYDSDHPAPAPRIPPKTLDSTQQLELWLRQLLREGQDGELMLRGAGQAQLCLFDGRIAWIRLSGYPEHLGDVMRRELGLTDAVLRQAITHCRSSGQRFGEGLVAQEIVQPSELRDCMHRHISDQFRELLDWTGPLTAEHSVWPYRYDHAYTFELDELLAQPSRPSAEEQRRLETLVKQCFERLPRVQIACVIEIEEGIILHTSTRSEEAQYDAEDLLSLCTAGLHRLAANRLTRRDGAPDAMVFNTKSGCLVVQRLPWRPEWLLVLGGRDQTGRALSIAAELSMSVR